MNKSALPWDPLAILSSCFLVWAASAVTVRAGAPCLIPDNGSGTATTPAQGCPFTNATEVQLRAADLEPLDSRVILKTYFLTGITSDVPGGNLGGNRQTATATVTVEIRNVANTLISRDIPVQLVTDTTARPHGASLVPSTFVM